MCSLSEQKAHLLNGIGCWCRRLFIRATPNSASATRQRTPSQQVPHWARRCSVVARNDCPNSTIRRPPLCRGSAHRRRRRLGCQRQWRQQLLAAARPLTALQPCPGPHFRFVWITPLEWGIADGRHSTPGWVAWWVAWWVSLKYAYFGSLSSNLNPEKLHGVLFNDNISCNGRLESK